MQAPDFWAELKNHGLTFFAGVPDSTFGDAYNVMVADPEIRYLPAVSEAVALGIASSAYFTGGLGGVIMQNSGVGNLVNPLTSFNLMYKIPAFIIVGWRGYGGPPNDAPEHWIMGDKTAKFFELLDMPYEILDAYNLDLVLKRLLAAIRKRSVPGALLIRAGVIQ